MVIRGVAPPVLGGAFLPDIFPGFACDFCIRILNKILRVVAIQVLRLADNIDGVELLEVDVCGLTWLSSTGLS
jgi:hypothetical protein